MTAQDLSWRSTERMLVAFFMSHRISVDDIAGMPVVELVRYREAREADESDEIETASVSLEHLAKYLVEGLGQ